MNILLIDIDTLRPDHMGCYGYQRNTTPCIDRIAKEGVCFNEYYCSDAPCLPSRAALITGQFGIHNGVVGHGGTSADRRLDGPERAMQDRSGKYNLPVLLQAHGYYTVSCSSFAPRHGAWWFNAGFRELYNGGKNGLETADEMTPWAVNWLENNAKKTDRVPWFLHFHLWDPHMPARTPSEVKNHFEDEPLADRWMTQDRIDCQRRHNVGPHSSMEVTGYDDNGRAKGRQVLHIADMADYKADIDGYDLGVWYADYHIGKLIDKLKELNIYNDTAVIVTSDHGECLGELGIYNEHGDADYCTTHVPMIIKWPGAASGIKLNGLHYNVDLLPTLAELLGGFRTLPLPAGCGKGPEHFYDGESYAHDLLRGLDLSGREYLVVSQCAHVCQRAVRFGNFIYIRTYHDGYHLTPDEELFNVKEDPHETHNLANELPEVCWHGAWYLEHWTAQQMLKMSGQYFDDPMWRVIHEGGPFHCKGHLSEYCDRLNRTGRSWATQELTKRHPTEF